ncbi:MAG: hypothetical protein ABIE68_04445 [bacterium]
MPTRCKVTVKIKYWHILWRNEFIIVLGFFQFSITGINADIIKMCHQEERGAMSLIRDGT